MKERYDYCFVRVYSMEELKELFRELNDKGLKSAVFSNAIDTEKGSKIKIHPILLKGKLTYQRTLFLGTKVYHENLSVPELTDRMSLDMENYRQAEFTADGLSAYILVSKKGKMTIKKKYTNQAAEESRSDMVQPASHNREKQYILKEGILVGLGVQTPEGKIVKSKYDKFRQINRYLEFIEDIVRKLPTDRPVRIVDFGCGKSYLTFAMYYYLHVLKGYEVRITGLDLKADVIALCNRLAEEYGYTELHFEQGDISSYEGENQVDMVVTLHACDTATDYALYNAICWNADMIFSVPCCQHELNQQMHTDTLSLFTRYGIVQERMAALTTDAIRGNLLTCMGYKTQLLEFVDLSHTPKNLLIRAVKSPSMSRKTRTA